MYMQRIERADPPDTEEEVRRFVVGLANGFSLSAVLWLVIGGIGFAALA
jgi:hypothetical protein